MTAFLDRMDIVDLAGSVGARSRAPVDMLEYTVPLACRIMLDRMQRELDRMQRELDAILLSSRAVVPSAMNAALSAQLAPPGCDQLTSLLYPCYCCNDIRVLVACLHG